jgi:hypothetical protein
VWATRNLLRSEANSTASRTLQFPIFFQWSIVWLLIHLRFLYCFARYVSQIRLIIARRTERHRFDAVAIRIADEGRVIPLRRICSPSPTK